MSNNRVIGVSRIGLPVLFFAGLLAAVFYCDINYSFSHQGWMTISTLAMVQFSAGAWIRQTLVRSVVIVVVLSIATICHVLPLPYVMPILFVVSLLVGVFCLIFEKVLLYLDCILFSMLLLLTNFMTSIASFQDQLIDVLIASIIMLIVSSVATLFAARLSFINLMLKYIDYLIALTNQVLCIEVREHHDSISFNSALLSQSSWVFAPGLSPGLRAGFRYYLLEIERAMELLYSINKNAGIITKECQLRDRFFTIMANNKMLLKMLRDFFLVGAFTDQEIDWMQDLIEFERSIEKALPVTMQVIQFNSSDLVIVGLLRNCKDLRQILLNLLLALPNSLR